MFRFGLDSYFIGYGVLLLIPEIIELSINIISDGSVFARIPFWLLTCMVVAMFVSLIIRTAFVNRKNGGRKFKATPVLAVAFIVGIVYAIVGSIAFVMLEITLLLLITLVVGFTGLVVLSIQRKNWVSFF